MNKIVKTVNTRALRAAREDEALEEEIRAHEAAKNGNVIDEDGKEISAEDAVTKQIRSLEKRVADTKSYFQKRENDLVKQVDSLKIQLAEASKRQIEYPTKEEDLLAWKEKYPDLANIMKTMAMQEMATVQTALDEQRMTLEEQKYETEFNKQMNRITKAHEDFGELQGDDDFNEWVQKQPKHIRSVFDSEQPIPYGDLEDAADTAIYAITLFKNLTKKPEKKVDNNRDAARSVINRDTPPSPQIDRRPDLIYASDIEKNYPGRKYTDAVDEMVNKAMMEGRFVDDINGAAR